MEQVPAGDSKEPETETEGERYLRLLGLSHLADKKVTTKNGETLEARDFLDVCGEHARPMLVGFESMSEDDPRYESTLEGLRGVVSAYIESPSA